MSKSTLYTFNLSVWSAAADLARIELGLVDKIYAKQVDVLQGESVAPWFLKINHAGTVPVVVADGKLYGDTTLTIEYMASISSVKIAPRTDLTAIVHNDAHDPNLMLRSARNEGDIARKAGWKGPLTTRVAKIKEYAALPESAPYKDLFDRRIATFQTMLDVFSGTASDEQKRVFFAKSQANYEAAKTFVLETLPAAIGEGPFVAGATPGEDDFHIAAWLFRASRSGGGTKGSDGIAAFEDWFGAPVPEAVKALWNAWIVKESWKEVYPHDTLH